jgi:hypothetical protein
MSLEAIYAHLGLIAEISSLLGAVACGYLMQVILKERSPLVQLQRFSLAVLAVALVANGSFVYPSWALIEGHRPTGALVDVALLFNLLVMALRGHLVVQPGLPHSGGRQPASQRGGRA